MHTATAETFRVDSSRTWIDRLNSDRHELALRVFTFIVLAHWAEHFLQGLQIYAFGWPVPEARGALGLFFPALIKSEALHYEYALVMLVGLWMLRTGFSGKIDRFWWMLAFGIQFFHHIEHAILQGQVILGQNLMGRPLPTSLVQLWVPRVELHLFYNTIVFVPMMIAMYYHLFPPAEEQYRSSARARCTPVAPLAPRDLARVRRIDLLRWPIVGSFLRWRHFRTTNQILLLLVALAIVLHGLLGPDLAQTNLATVLTWIHYRGLLIGALLLAANVFCSACPMILVRDVGRRVRAPTLRWPGWLGRKWVAIVLFATVLFAYELFDLWALPAATAWLVIGYFGAALLVDLTFKGAAFCTHVCPVGQFNFVASTLSPLELQVRERQVCRACTTVDCIKGRRDTAAPARPANVEKQDLTPRIVQRGCELGLFLPLKTGNLDCTFCLDCVQACPHDNVAIGFRVPGEELIDDRRRSVIGRLSRRADLAALAVLFTFGALLNGFAMTGPIYDVEQAIARGLRSSSESLVLGVEFMLGLAVVPVALCAGAAFLTQRMARSGMTTREIAIRYAYGLVPLGAGVWLAHYGFHFLTGVWTAVPVSQSAAFDVSGRAFLGEPLWAWVGMRAGAVFPLEIGAVLLGALGSFVLVYRISERDHPGYTARAATAWMFLVASLLALAVWMLTLPMDMRGTGVGG